MARRASVIGVSVLTVLGGMVALAPTAPAAPTPSAAGSAVSVTVADLHSCVLTTAGGVRCWGDNSTGQLGTSGVGSHSSRPVDVVGLTSGVAQVSSGGKTTCAVTTVGGVKCWGDNHNGQLGNGSLVNSATPVDVVGLTSGVRSVSVSSYLSCAVTTAGAAKCWGWGVQGGLGNGTQRERGRSTVPVDVVGLGSGVRAVSAGAYHACALTTSGVSCWGRNYSGALGNGARGRQLTPVQTLRLDGRNDLISISAGRDQTCVLTNLGHVLCWGSNYAGTLGVGATRPQVLRPLPVDGLTGVSAISTGSGVCAVGAHQTLCWGSNGNGNVGDGTTTQRTAPVPVVGLVGTVTGVAMKDTHTCAVTAAGRVFCWGYNHDGELGDGTTDSSLTAVRVVGLGA